MSDEQQRHPHAPAEGGWQPIPRGAEMDAEGTTFFQIPPELLADPAPRRLGPPWRLRARATHRRWRIPGSSTPEPQPHPAPGQAPTDWVRDDVYGHVGAAPAGGAAPADVHGHGADIHGHEHGHLGGAVHMDGQAPLNAHPDPSADAMAGAAGPVDRDADPHATAQWPMPFASDEGAGSTGQWSVPAAGDDPVEESGEYRLRENVPAPAAPVEPSHAEIMAEAWRQPLAAAAPVAVPVPEPALAATGEHQWSVPAAPVETVDESGEYALSSVHDDGTHRAAHGDADGITGTGEIPTGSWTTGGGAAEPATQPAVEAGRQRQPHPKPLPRRRSTCRWTCPQTCPSKRRLSTCPPPTCRRSRCRPSKRPSPNRRRPPRPPNSPTSPSCPPKPLNPRRPRTTSTPAPRTS
ncbi:hypothetical protein GCM10020000_50290 [Streptomyces olivoverticillatus]